MKLLSVNVAQAEPIANVKSGKTGIYKRPIATPVTVTKDGLAGDTVCDTQNHGGVDQAVYLYGSADYAWWSQTLGRDLPPGTFGENLTVSDLESTSFCVGDSFCIGSALLQVTAPRIPCVTLATRMGESSFVKRFRAAERPGLYCRVLQAGVVQAGDEVTVRRYEGDTVTVLEMFRDFFAPTLSKHELRRYLAAPIAVRDRVEKEAQLQKLTAKLGEPQL